VNAVPHFRELHLFDAPEYHIRVIGTPAPQGSKKFVGLAKSGRGILVESSKKVKPWREDVKAAAEAARAGRPALDGALVARMVFTLQKPASAPKRKRLYPMRKPDLSKLVRSTEDALADAGLIADDARIVEYLRVAKVFPGEDPEALEVPGVLIWIGVLSP
jgi:Holliday junction resolvase RusA-like endonuclease